jgi:hypothetical protein
MKKLSAMNSPFSLRGFQVPIPRDAAAWRMCSRKTRYHVPASTAVVDVFCFVKVIFCVFAAQVRLPLLLF